MQNLVIALMSLSMIGTAAEMASPVGTVISRAPFTVQGVEVPVAGNTSWPAMEGDVIQTRSAPAEIRMKDGTRIFMPASSRLVVRESMQTGGRAAVIAIDNPGTPMVAKKQNGFLTGVLNVLDGGAFAVKPSMLEQVALAAPNKRYAGSTTSTITSLTGLLGLYGVNSPVVAAVDQALSTVGGSVSYNATSNTYFITGISVSVNGAAPTPATIEISATQITVVPGTITATTPPPVNPPTPIVVVTPPPTGSTGSPAGCKGTSLTPGDVSQSVVTVSTAGSC
jgi:hypothetical protein